MKPYLAKSETRQIIKYGLVVFPLFMAILFVSAKLSYNSPGSFNSFLKGIFSNGKSGALVPSSISQFSSIFVSNSLLALASIVGGLLFAVVPVFFLLSDSIFFGKFFGATARFVGVGFVLANAVPHSIIELPTICLAIGCGIWLGVRVIRRVFRGQKGVVKKSITTALTFYVVVILPLVLVAALIEAFITPQFGHHFASAESQHFHSQPAVQNFIKQNHIKTTN